MSPNVLCFFTDHNLLASIADRSNIEVCTLSRTSDNLYSNISLCSLELERILIERELLWSATNIPPKVIIVWGELNCDLNDIVNYTKDFRGDELLIYKHNQTNWIAGNARAIIKWAAPVSKLKNITVSRTLANGEFDYSNLIWWAVRLNLKLYTLIK